MNKQKMISDKLMASWSEQFHADRANLIASNASVTNGFTSASTDHAAAAKLPYTFSLDLTKQGSITNQKASGRCWLFSAMNIFRYEIITKYNLKDFELSQNYMFFYDKLERANYYLENMIKIADEPVTGRLFSFLNMDPMGDGGQWDMMANLVRKYGVVPKNIYPDGANSIKSYDFNPYLSSLLREYAVELRKMLADGHNMEDVRARKQDQMAVIYRFLCIVLGEPPKTFDFTVTDKDGKVYQDFGIDGKAFFEKYVGMDLDDYVSLINAPTEDKPMNRTYTVRYLGNVAEGLPIKYLNLPIEVIKAAAIAQLKDGKPVWFGSDCGPFSLRDLALFDRASANVEQLVNIHYNFTKGDRLVYGDSAMNHAMVFLGVNLNKDGAADRWRIENSWGDESGPNGGYYIASDNWFDEYVYQVVVNRKYLSDAVVKLLDQEMTELEPWDPMGTLAN